MQQGVGLVAVDAEALRAGVPIATLTRPRPILAQRVRIGCRAVLTFVSCVFVQAATPSPGAPPQGMGVVGEHLGHRGPFFSHRMHSRPSGGLPTLQWGHRHCSEPAKGLVAMDGCLAGPQAWPHRIPSALDAGGAQAGGATLWANAAMAGGLTHSASGPLSCSEGPGVRWA